MGFCFVLVKLKQWGFKKISRFYKLKFEAYLRIWLLRGINSPGSWKHQRWLSALEDCCKNKVLSWQVEM